MMMRVHWLQYVEVEDLGATQPPLTEQGGSRSCSRLYVDDTLPDPAIPASLILPGAPTSVRGEAQSPRLQQDKPLIHELLARQVPVFGSCRGPADSQSFSLPEQFTAFPWHGETVDLPAGAVLFSRSNACDHQALQCGDQDIGPHFDLEIAAEGANATVANCGYELDGTGLVHTPENSLPWRKATV